MTTTLTELTTRPKAIDTMKAVVFHEFGKSDVLWRNSSTGANAIWRSGSYSTQQAVTGVTDMRWEVVGVDDFDGDGLLPLNPQAVH